MNSNEFENKTDYFSGALGAIPLDDSTCFTVWAPKADGVLLRLYSSPSDAPCEEIPLSPSSCGTWSYTYPKRLCGMYYNLVFNYGGTLTECVDIYAKACSSNGTRGYIPDLEAASPSGWENEGYVKLKSPTDAVIYELSVRDFSTDPSSKIPPSERGKFAAFCQKNTKLNSGEPTCLGHLKKLGITHVQLMPIFDFAGVDENAPLLSYNWGYNPVNYNIPEGSYSKNPSDPELRIKELKSLVRSLHEEGIGVVMDVVYNHTWFTENSNFNITYPDYYYRKNPDGSYSSGSGCGNEIASERPMVRKYIIDSVLYWAREFKIDGFRFDLMAVLDIDTMNILADRLLDLNPSALLYGEGWTGGSIAITYDKSTSKQNARYSPKYAFFNDTYRDAIKGDNFVESGLGYVNGNFHYKQSIVNGLLGSVNWAGSPAQSVNYCEAHDNLTLWDKLTLSAGCNHEEDRKKMSRLATALVILAQGIPFIHAGQEFLRSKPLGDGRFSHNSYNSPDIVNSLKWYLLDENRRESDYCAGLIAFRKAHPVLRLTNYWDVEHASEVLSSPDGTAAIKLSYRGDELLILVNPVPRAKMFILPDGEWNLHISDIKASAEPLATYCEGVIVPPISAMVLVKKN